MNFPEAFDILMTHEGGFSNHPDDPGGATMYGVTETVARAEGYVGPMSEMTLDFAKQVYKKRYWDACNCDRMPDQLRYPLFDAAVNSGVTQAIKWLQDGLFIKADGKIGPQTMGAVNSCFPLNVRQRMIGARLRFLTGLMNWPTFAKGWTRRIAAILEM